VTNCKKLGTWNFEILITATGSARKGLFQTGFDDLHNSSEQGLKDESACIMNSILKWIKKNGPQDAVLCLLAPFKDGVSLHALARRE
jgi:hypothetical protein